MKRRGFTLTELLIVIALTSVVLTAIITMVLSIRGFSQSRDSDFAVNDGILTVESRITSWFSGFDTGDYPEPKVSEDGTILYCGEKSATFDINEGKLILGDESSVYPWLCGISFSQTADNPNLVKCTLSYSMQDSERTYTFMLLKRSVNAVQP